MSAVAAASASVRHHSRGPSPVTTVPTAEHGVEGGEDQDPDPEVDRQQRRRERTRHPRELEHHLVAHEHPALRARRGVALHQALEREPAELGGRPRDEREDREQRQPEAARTRAPRRCTPRSPQATTTASSRVVRAAAARPRRRRTCRARPPPRGPRTSRRRRPRRAARTRAGTAGTRSPRACPPRRSPGPRARARRPASDPPAARRLAAGCGRVRQPQGEQRRDRVDDRGRSVDRPPATHRDVMAPNAKGAAEERADRGDPAEPRVRPHQPLAGAGVRHREPVLRDRVHLRQRRAASARAGTARSVPNAGRSVDRDDGSARRRRERDQPPGSCPVEHGHEQRAGERERQHREPR